MNLSDEASLIDYVKTASPEELQALDQLLKQLESQETHQPDTLSEYSAKLQESISKQRELTERGQEIGPLPPCKDPQRRANCKYNLELWMTTYCQQSLLDKKKRYIGFSPAQKEMIATLQNKILNGGKAARAVRRGGFKTTIARLACIWAVLNGHWMYVLLIGATDDNSEQMRENIPETIKALPKLIEDYPEVIPLLLKLANPKRQLRLNGELIECTAKDERGCIVFPQIAGVECSGAKIAPFSIMSTGISGLQYVYEGRTIRPDGVILDDVQTPESALSHEQTQKRENKITTTVAGLAGTGFEMTMIYVGTVRQNDDLTMRMCDQEKHPDWDGKVFKVLLRKPDDKEHWAVYEHKLRNEGNTPAERMANATAYFVEHEEIMSRGGKVSWENDKAEGYVSCLQWCMTMSMISPEYFRTELQQEGAPPPAGQVQLVVKELMKRVSPVTRGIIPAKASFVTAFVDSSDHVLWWMVCAWLRDFTGWIVDYGNWPDQKRIQFYKSELPRPLELELPNAPWEQAFVHAHNKLDAFLLGKEWPTETGGKRAIDRLGKDWGDNTTLIENQILASPYRDRIRPTKGFAPKPGKKKVAEYGDPKLDTSGDGWTERMTASPKHIQFDANIFKSNVYNRMTTVIGAPSALLMPGDDEENLVLLGDHLTSEVAKRDARGDHEGVAWELLPGRDNDQFDCLVGNAVVAASLGCLVPGQVLKAKRELEVFSIPRR